MGINDNAANYIVINNAAERQFVREAAPRLLEQLQAAAEKIVSGHNNSVEGGRKLIFEKPNIYNFTVRQSFYPASTLFVECDLNSCSVDSYCWLTPSADSQGERANNIQLLLQVARENIVFSDGERLMTVEATAQILLEPVLSSARG